MVLSGTDTCDRKIRSGGPALLERVTIMRELFANSCFHIAAGQAVSGVAGQAQSLRIASGRVWLTVEGELGDYWLSAGDNFAVPAGRLVVIEADKVASRVDFSGARRPSIAAGLGAQLNRLAQRLSVSKTGAMGYAPCGSR
ncbi:hypothetical protein ACFDR9_005263 [Janthinobacterium sp. CG_23.3]